MKQEVHLLRTCALVTSIVVVISLLSRLLVDASVVSSKGTYLLDKAVYWHEMSEIDNDPILRLEHCAIAVAFINAAREHATDTELETSAGIDISRVSRRLERSLISAREARHTVGAQIRV